MAGGGAGAAAAAAAAAAPLSPEILRGYLKILRLEPPLGPPSLLLLKLLFQAHLDTIPYETLDIVVRRPAPPLDTLSAAARVVTQRRGGYCFELVAAFAALLRTLGFDISLHRGVCGDTTSCEGAPWRGSGGGAVEPSRPSCPNHVVLVASLDGRRYVADVGLGDGPPEPFELAEGGWELKGRQYDLRMVVPPQRGPDRGVVWRWRHTPSASFPGMDFEDAPIGPTDADFATAFWPKHGWYHGAPASMFLTSGVVVYRVRPDGAVLKLRGRTLYKLGPEGTEPKVVATAATLPEWVALTTDHFGIHATASFSSAELAHLWAVVQATPVPRGLHLTRQSARL